METDEKREMPIESEKKAAAMTKREAKTKQKNKALLEASKTQKALNPLRERVLTLVQEYEANASFEHARRMSRLLNNIVIASEICIQEAEKDLGRISVGENTCQPSALRQRLCDYFWDN